MRKTSSTPKKYPYHFTESDLRTGCGKCIDNVKNLLFGAKLLLRHRDKEEFALGLYMYAVEEYGKAILLKKSIIGDRRKYLIDGWILGFGNPGVAHESKIITGFDNLPQECRRILRGLNIRKSEDSNKTIILKKNKHGHVVSVVSAHAGMTGKIIDPIGLDFSDYNVDLKTACFYMDWDQVNKSWRHNLITDVNDLKSKIKKFEKELMYFDCLK